MSGYQVLARRFRPQRFDQLVGQDVVVRTLQNALASGQIAHAYLFSGLRGVGKTTVARLLAKALNCEHGPTPEPCGDCVPCTEIANGISLDVLELDAASNRGIDEVRQLRDIAKVLPVRDRYRVFILDEAHQLSRDAFNALLKILEEPPAHVIFVLASTEKHKFPATILSRCLQVDFRPIPIDVIVARLAEVAAAEGFPLTHGAAELIARSADGSLRDALSLLDGVRAFADQGVDEPAVAEVLGLSPAATLLAVWDALAVADVAATLRVVRGEESLGRDPVAFYDQVVQLVETLLVLACDRSAPVPYPETMRGELAARGEAAGIPLLVRALKIAVEQRGVVAVADRPGLAVAVSCARLALWPRLVRVEELLAGTEPREASPGVAPAAPAAGSARRSPVAHDGGGDDGPRGRLAAALDKAGAHLLAGRVRRAQVTVDAEVLRLAFPGAPPGTVRSAQEERETLAAAAGAAGLPVRVEVEGGNDADAGAQGLRQRVESDEAVKRVLDVFGGRIERVEET
jgi:DNA polymerase III subunit gamma/tau